MEMCYLVFYCQLDMSKNYLGRGNLNWKITLKGWQACRHVSGSCSWLIIDMKWSNPLWAVSFLRRLTCFLWENNHSKQEAASLQAALLHGYCLQDPALSCYLEFPQWWTVTLKCKKKYTLSSPGCFSLRFLSQ